jgi:hypothetical protein
MKNKILFSLFALALVFGVVGFAGTIHAQVAPNFLAGCTSDLGYSVTNGSPCNGTAIATLNVPGCTTVLGYSITSGAPCDGASVAIPYLNGCTSVYGYSTLSGAACSGTNLVQYDPTATTTPGLPVTGAGTNALVDLTLLFSLAVVAVGSGIYLAKKIKITA